jgi:hypothetical protein
VNKQDQDSLKFRPNQLSYIPRLATLRGRVSRYYEYSKYLYRVHAR